METASPSPSPERFYAPGASPPDLGSDWEAFYQNYRRPDYVPGYEIVNRLGTGTFGVVFKARKPSIGKFYAIKFLRVEDGDLKEAIERELDSVRVFAQIDHPNLVSIEDRGEVDGIPFIVMGYAGEETLKTRLSAGPLAPAEALDIFRQVCGGVGALHAVGLAHFDLKPANVFLKGSLARVGDYGLSKLVRESRKTLSFGRGTPYYMAPEMLRRHGDHRSDLYSLGCLLFEMLTGEVPFKGETEWEVLKRHETEAPSFPRGFPSKLRPVVARCLEKEPENRYAGVEALLADLGVETPVAAPASNGSSAAAAGSKGPLADRIGRVVSEVRSLRDQVHAAWRRGATAADDAPAPAPGPTTVAAELAAEAPPRPAGWIEGTARGVRGAFVGFARAVEFLATLPFRVLGVGFRVLGWGIGVLVRLAVFALGVGVAFLVGLLLFKVVGTIFANVGRAIFGAG
jgi:tRNA A-37 threonylcarbamoyl transferase component Bud32